MPIGTDWKEYFRLLSSNASALASQFNGLPVTQEDLMAGAIEITGQVPREILLSRLSEAIEQVEEYQHPDYKDILFEVFSRSEMLTYNEYGININAMEVAGDWADLFSGIEFARAELGVGFSLDKKSALAFWMERIYIPARMGGDPVLFKKQKKDYDYAEYGRIKYEETLGARRRGWQNMAPFWLWLEYGNPGGGPENAPTHFVSLAEVEINTLLRDALIVATEKIMDGVYLDAQRFLENPEAVPTLTETEREIAPWAAYRSKVETGRPKRSAGTGLGG